MGGRLCTGRGSSPWHLGLDRIAGLWLQHRRVELDLYHGRAGGLKAGRWVGLALLTPQGHVPAGPVPRIRPHLRSRLSRPRMEPERRRYPRMREVVFHVLAERPGHLEAQAESMPIRITAPTRCGCAATPVPPSAASGRWDALRRSVVDPGGPSPRPRPAPPRSPARSCWPLTIPPPWSGSTGLC